MGVKRPKVTTAMATLAGRQHGYITRAQLVSLGFTDDQIKVLVRNRVLIRVHLAVYAVGHVPNTPVARTMAAVLACGPDAVASHATAAALWGFRKHRSGPIEVTAPGRHRRPGITAHRSPLTRAEKTKHLGIPVTTPARTLLDIAPSLTRPQRTRAINDALLSKYLHEADLEGTCLEGFVGELSRSPLEDDFRPWVKRYGLPEPRYNSQVNGREVDVYFSRERLIIELDGWAIHSTRRAFEDDRERDAHMLRVGIATIRITRDRLVNAPVKEAERLLAILAARRG